MCPIGKASFGAEKLMTNLDTVLEAIAKAKPAAAKGQYFKSATVGHHHGPRRPRRHQQVRRLIRQNESGNA